MFVLPVSPSAPHLRPEYHHFAQAKLDGEGGADVPLIKALVHKLLGSAGGSNHPEYFLQNPSPEGPQAFTEGAGETRDLQQLRLWDNSRRLLAWAKEQGLIQSWVITHGTLVFALRFGANRDVRLPSGWSDFVPEDYDMDVIVRTDDWVAFLKGVAPQAVKEFGFNWLGSRFRANGH